MTVALAVALVFTAAGGVEPATARNSELRVGGRAAELTVSSVSAQTVRLTIAPLTNGTLTPIPQSGALLPTAESPPRARISTFPKDPTESRAQTIRCGDVTVRVSPQPLTLQIETRDGRLVQRLVVDSASGSLSFLPGSGPVLGLGEGGAQFDRRGAVDLMRSGQGGYRLRTHGGRVPIPWLIGTGGWALFVHQPYGTFDLTGAEGRFRPASPETSLPLDVFVIAAREPTQVMAEYARLTGFPELPPLWSLGYQQSHRTLSGPEEVLRVARTFREKKLPCDALIYLGTDFCPAGWNTHNGEFAWHPTNFPNPATLIDELHAAHFKVALHIVLEGRRLVGTVNDPDPGPLQPSGRTADGRWPAARQVSGYWPFHKPLFELGIDGWWPDQGDGLDAPSRLARNRMYFEGAQQYRPYERPYALHRNGYAGMQRYAAFLWSGDVYSTWETLRTHVPVAINTGLSGIPYWGTDIGGFVPTKEYTGELHVRWFQFGAFCPLFRAHGRTWHLRLPWGWNTGELGPTEVAGYTAGASNPDPVELRNSAVEPICRKYLELRYRMMPYLYSVVREGHDTGLPVMRALWLHYPDDPAAVARGDEYLWGRDLLVAPVTEPGASARRLYLPRGDWYDFWTELRTSGGRELDRAVDLATMPLYVRAGAIIPLGPVKQYTSERVDAPTTLLIYPGADGSFTLYEDDGVSFNFRQGEWTGLRATWDDRRRRFSLRLVHRPPGSAPTTEARRRFEIRIAGEQKVRALEFDGRPLEVRL